MHVGAKLVNATQFVQQQPFLPKFLSQVNCFNNFNGRLINCSYRIQVSDSCEISEAVGIKCPGGVN